MKLQDNRSALAIGSVFALCVTGHTFAGLVTNGDFNADTFTIDPGYASAPGQGNGPITGWSSSLSGTGLNPTTDSQPFAPRTYSSAVDGPFAFLQTSPGSPTTTLAQSITGLTPGRDYELSYVQAPRNGNAGNSTLTGSIGALSNAIAGTTDSFTHVAGIFRAASSSMSLIFSNSLNAPSTDATMDVTHVSVTPVSSQPFVFNGDFESYAGEFTNYPGYVGAHNPNQVVGFHGPAGGGYGLNPGSGAGTPFRDNGNDSSNVLFIQTAGTVLTQDIPGFIAGGHYRLTFDYNARSGGPTGILVTIDGQSFANPLFNDVGGNNPYYVGTIDFTPTSNTETLSVEKTTTPGDTTALFDNFQITAIPEPASLGLIAVGTLGLISRRRRD